jgi:hypothetical protein
MRGKRKGGLRMRRAMRVGTQYDCNTTIQIVMQDDERIEQSTPAGAHNKRVHQAHTTNAYTHLLFAQWQALVPFEDSPPPPPPPPPPPLVP